LASNRLLNETKLLDKLVEALGLSLSDGLSLVGAQRLGEFPLEPSLPLLIFRDKEPLGSLTLTLGNDYPQNHTVTVFNFLAGELQRSESRLSDMASLADLGECVLYLAPLPLEENLRSIRALPNIVRRLRAPDGCPWDREQTHSTLNANLIEEAYEVLEALDEDDMKALAEELGDLMLQIVLHAQIAAEEGDFTLADVSGGICAKIIRRHPHVFGQLAVADTEEVIRNWEEIKKWEKGEGASIFSGVPSNIPALAGAQRIAERASKFGWDWKSISGVIEKCEEEIKELAEAQDPQTIQHEFGDLLFTLVNLARWLKVDAEEALRLANRKFIQRFARLEELCLERNLRLSKLTEEQMDELWEQAKKE